MILIKKIKNITRKFKELKQRLSKKITTILSHLLLSMPLILLLQGCTLKSGLLIPQSLLEPPLIEVEDMNITTQEQAAILLLLIYEGYSECALQIDGIRRLYGTSIDN